MESLNVSGMMKNKHLSKAIQQQKFYEFKSQIEYKSKLNGIEFIQVDKFYPSSKTCSCCGNIKKDLKLSNRMYKCDVCGLVIDRDYNASINLANHRTNQLGYPIMIIAAGLPKIYSMLSSEKSYSERVFIYKEIDSLEREQAIKAIEMPIKQFNVKYSDKAINKIIEVTEGYPFFIQQLCQIVFQNVDSKVISDIDVENNLEEFFGKLDTGFFKLRYERCSAAEKKFIFAMVKCGELPCTIANIAEIMKKSINSISTARAQLINKGIIYPVKYRELDFTVPQFSGFIHRLEEYKQWDTI